MNGKPRRVGIALPVGACQSVHLPFRARDICDRPPANADDSDISRVAQRDTVSPRRGAGLRGSADADGADASAVSHSESRRSTVLDAHRCPEAGAASEFHRFRGSSFRGFGSRRLCGSRGAPSPDCTGDSDAARVPVAVATHPRLGAVKIATSVTSCTETATRADSSLDEGETAPICASVPMSEPDDCDNKGQDQQHQLRDPRLLALGVSPHRTGHDDR